MKRLSLARHVVVLLVALVVCLPPGVALVRDLTDAGLAAPNRTPQRAITLHRDLTPRIARWARDHVASGRAAHFSLHDVPTTEWPIFTAVFYLLGTEQLEAAWRRGELGDAPEPMSYARVAVDAARDLVVDPVHHTWVRTHWGDDYLHRENVFFRALVISALTSHRVLTGDRSDEPMLRDQVETLSSALDASPLGLLNDYPHECYPIDVVVAVAWIRHADAVLGTDHSAFVARELRAFTGAEADDHDLVRYRVDLTRGAVHAHEVQPARGIGMSWILVFTPDLWPTESRDWYARYERDFWQDHGWASGFREYAAGTELENGFEIDAGPVLDGFGTAASAFGIAAARRNGRFDQAYALETEMSAASWTLPDGTMLFPRMISHAADAPYLGEAALQYFLTVPPAEGVAIVPATAGPSGLVYFGLLVYLGVPLLALLSLVRALTREAAARKLKACSSTVPNERPSGAPNELAPSSTLISPSNTTTKIDPSALSQRTSASTTTITTGSSGSSAPRTDTRPSAS